MKFETFIGIDVSKKTFDVVLRAATKPSQHTQYSNDEQGITALLKDLKQAKVKLTGSLICLEHTGIYTHLLLKQLYAKKANLWLEQPLSLKRSLGIQRGKNDKVDAARMAEYADRFQDKAVLWKPARQEISRLNGLIKLRDRLIKTKKILATPVKEMAEVGVAGKSELKALTGPVVEQLNAQLNAVEQHIEALIRDDAHLQRLQAIITSVDGVGKVTAWQMIVTTNEFQDFTDSRKFACFSGVVPFDHSSGTSVYARPRVSHMANKRMKELLHMSALSATTMKKSELNDYYQRKVAEGKNKMLVLNNLRNKIVQRVFACVKDNRKYEKNYAHALA